MFDRERIQFLTAVRWHLDYNFYPLGSMSYLCHIAVEALDNCNNGEPDKLVTVTNGLSYPSAELVEALRLEDMVTTEDYSY